MQDMLPGVLSTVLTLLGLTVANSSEDPIEYFMTMNSSVLHSSSGLLMSRGAGIGYRVQYDILGRRFDTSYPTGGYDVSGDQ
ncbi:hypothetical protein Tco_1200237 [Tanacetum coccineum]